MSPNARRAGWVGCNIDISNVVDFGKIFLVKNSQIINQNLVQEHFNNTLFIRTKNIESRGWILDIMMCIDSISKDTFNLKDIYDFEEILKIKALLNQNTYLNHPFHLANSKLSVFSIIFWHLE